MFNDTKRIKKALKIFFLTFFIVLLPMFALSGMIWLIANYTSGIVSTVLIIALLAFIIAIAATVSEA